MSEQSQSRSGEAANEGLFVTGVGRMADYEKALIVYFNRPIFDDDLRAFHDSIRGAVRSEQQQLPRIVWPKEKTVGRMGEMAPKGDMNLNVHLQDDGDVLIECWEVRYGRGERACVEFCTPGPGGGRSPKTREALIALMVAIEADNAANPERAFPPKPAERPG